MFFLPTWICFLFLLGISFHSHRKIFLLPIGKCFHPLLRKGSHTHGYMFPCSHFFCETFPIPSGKFFIPTRNCFPPCWKIFHIPTGKLSPFLFLLGNILYFLPTVIRHKMLWYRHSFIKICNKTRDPPEKKLLLKGLKKKCFSRIIIHKFPLVTQYSTNIKT